MTQQSAFSFKELVKSDFQANKKSQKGFLVLLLYRIAHTHLYVPAYLKPFTRLYLFLYHIITAFFVGTDIHWRCEIGPSARIFHGFGIVIHRDAKIGSHVILRHGVTIGAQYTKGENLAPVIGDYVDIGASAIILGRIKVGHHAVIAAGSVVTKDIPDYAVVVGNPGRIIRTTPAV